MNDQTTKPESETSEQPSGKADLSAANCSAYERLLMSVDGFAEFNEGKGAKGCNRSKFIGRKLRKILYTHGRALKKARAKRIKKTCEAAGWLDVHGGPEDGGMYWRGVNPETRRVEEIPQSVFKPNA